MKSRILLWCVGAVLAAALVGSAYADDGPAAPGAEKAELAAAVKERSIYIPYKELKKVFEKEGRGVFMP